MTVYELKAQCKSKNLRTSGNKQELINRLSGIPDIVDSRRNVLHEEFNVIIKDSDFHRNDKKYSRTELCLLVSAKYGFINSVEFFVKKGARCFNEAMRWAARFGKSGIVEFCRKHGASDYDTAMVEAAAKGYIDIVLICKKYGGRDFNKAMAMAAEGGHIRIVKKCKRWGATNFDETMCRAGTSGKIKIVKKCRQWGAHTLVDETMLNAVQSGHVNIVKKCKKYEAKEFRLAAECAILNNRIEILKLFRMWNVIDIAFLNSYIGLIELEYGSNYLNPDVYAFRDDWAKN